MKPGDHVTLPDGRTGIVWRAQDGYVWVSIDGAHFRTEHWAAVDVVLRDESRQMSLPLDMAGSAE